MCHEKMCSNHNCRKTLKVGDDVFGVQIIFGDGETEECLCCSIQCSEELKAIYADLHINRSITIKYFPVNKIKYTEELATAFSEKAQIAMEWLKARSEKSEDSKE